MSHLRIPEADNLNYMAKPSLGDVLRDFVTKHFILSSIISKHLFLSGYIFNGMAFLVGYVLTSVAYVYFYASVPLMLKRRISAHMPGRGIIKYQSIFKHW